MWIAFFFRDCTFKSSQAHAEGTQRVQTQIQGARKKDIVRRRALHGPTWRSTEYAKKARTRQDSRSRRISGLFQ